MKIKLHLVSLLILLPVSLLAQVIIDARAAGMGFSNSADTRGLEQVGGNPATLALPHSANFEFNLFSGNASFSNNGVSKEIYDRYFTTGNTLSNSDKAYILSQIPDEGLAGNFSTKVNTFAVYMPKFSLSISGIGNGYFNIPKEVAEIGLYGMAEMGRRYDFSSAAGSGWGGVALSTGLALPVKFLQFAMFNYAAVGLTARYIVAMQYAEIIDANGYLQGPDFSHLSLDLEGALNMRRSSGGSGFGYDFGVVLQSAQKLTVSAAVLNAMGTINWQTDPKIYQYAVYSNEFTVNETTFDNNSNSLIVTHDTSYTTAAFSTRIPAVLDLGISYYLTKKLQITGELEKAFSEGMGTHPYTRVAIGGEFTGIPLLPIRTGVSFGGRQGFSAAMGFGLNLKYWFVDVGIINHGGFAGKNSRGYTVAATTRFRF
jgi:hypothetical protein